jgi:hypothetical protein
MDVAVKVSLQGGHTWEFRCEAGDPMVTGIVSALPGATVDPALPPDGLIQLESRSGEKLFVTRSSLVAVSITEIVEHRAALPDGGQRPGTSIPCPFVLLPDCLKLEARGAVAAAVLAAPRAANGAGLWDMDLDELPLRAASNLADAVDEARASFPAAMSADEQHLDLTILRAEAGARDVTLPPPAADELLAFIVILPAGEGKATATVDLADLIAGEGPEAFVPTRTISFRANSLLVHPPDRIRGPLRLTVDTDTAIILGSLRRGAALAAE